MDNIEITSEDLNELRQINPLALAQLQNIALARKLKEKDIQIESLMQTIVEPIETTFTSKDKLWLTEKQLLEANHAKAEEIGV
jgi:hypothetical protein